MRRPVRRSPRPTRVVSSRRDLPHGRASRSSIERRASRCAPDAVADDDQEALLTVDERTPNEPLSDDQLAEADAESDVLDADIEDVDSPRPAEAREPIVPDLTALELAEADAEADLVDADIEDA
jgi:hypothetical protein